MKWLLLIMLIASSGESESEVQEFDTEKACAKAKTELTIKKTAKVYDSIFAECFSEDDENFIKLDEEL